jgi:glycosyltransferase involved in cell wall biosynthesis
VVVPSLFPETFGYVVLEAFAVGTPVIVHEWGGALKETGVESGGGLGYRTDGELLLAMRRMVHDEELRAELAARGFGRRIGEWSEAEHIHRYFELIGRLRETRGFRPVYRPHRVDKGVPDQPTTLANFRSKKT